MIKKPKIGLASLYDTKQAGKWNSLWIFPGYVDGILKVGGIPLIIPFYREEADIRSIVSEFDGFLFPGGQDIDPSLYNEPLYDFCNEISPERDYMEMILFDEIRRQNKPILGICRGMQLFNVALGGTLYQDLPVQQKVDFPLQHMQKTEFVFPVHDIRIDTKSRLHEIVGEEHIRVNSMHHQGIAELSKKVRATAWAEDGLVEAIEIKEMDFGLAVQWHPEFLWQQRDYELNLFGALIEAAKKNSSR